MREIHATVGSLDDMGKAFTSAWHRVESGNDQASELICFESPTELYNVLSSKRIDLLKDLRSMQAVSVYALAKHLGRDYKNVHGDVKLLEQYGLIERDCDKVIAPYDMIHADFDLRKAA